MDAERIEKCRKAIASLVLQEHRKAVQKLIHDTAEIAGIKARNNAAMKAEEEHWGPSCGPGFTDRHLEYLEKALPATEDYKRLMDDVVQIMTLTFCEDPSKEKLEAAERNIAAAHKIIDLAGIPPAAGEKCDDPDCFSHLTHRMHELIELLKEVTLSCEDREQDVKGLKEFIHRVHGTLDTVLHAASPEHSSKTWLPGLMKECLEKQGIKT